ALYTFAFCIPKVFWMSSWTFGVAVAVNAITGASPILLMMFFKFRYSGRKSCPHSEIQCASSMAKNEMGTVLKKSVYSSFVRDSGATYSIFVVPFLMSSITFLVWVLFNEEFKTCATSLSDEIPLTAST